MPRTARIVIPDYPHHIIQRGHNRQVVFSAEEDYHYYLNNLAEWKEVYNCKIYAFCQMTNHVHLIINPGDNPENLGRLMKRVAGRQTRYINCQEGRSGTLWEGRFKSSPIDSNRYLLACCRYVEMNPVVARICADPADYPWSSCCSKVSGKRFEWLDLDSLYKSLALSDDERCKRYHKFLSETVSDQERETISRAVQRGQLTGGSSFVDEIERRLSRRIELRGQGRPRKVRK
ncbi:putative transposase [Desulfuromusa kysingii]|uniref:Putative transposase n=1 Tax=Desulfuromusa kysingii TaxID=37625 RepID=A0A1H4EIS1_9BACT|nr:transposase [Desulfuromusa kysingii]SEA84777.1 putative transposase [Desulfuromusa kysingii]